jgi:hypothetical protein
MNQISHQNHFEQLLLAKMAQEDRLNELRQASLAAELAQPEVDRKRFFLMFRLRSVLFRVAPRWASRLEL